MEVKTEIPIAFTLDKTHSAKRQVFVERLASRATERKRIPNGFAFHFVSESAQRDATRELH